MTACGAACGQVQPWPFTQLKLDHNSLPIHLIIRLKNQLERVTCVSSINNSKGAVRTRAISVWGQKDLLAREELSP